MKRSSDDENLRAMHPTQKTPWNRVPDASRPRSDRWRRTILQRWVRAQNGRTRLHVSMIVLVHVTILLIARLAI